MTGDLFHSDGSRKYLTRDERTAFLTAAAQFPHDVRSLCHVLTYTGCRLAEALALSADRVDLRASRLTFETLKKRKRGVYRTVPVPPDRGAGDRGSDVDLTPGAHPPTIRRWRGHQCHRVDGFKRVDGTTGRRGGDS
jgi:integrase